MFLRKVLIACLLAIIPAMAAGQVEPSFDDAIEQYLEENENEESAAEISDLLIELMENPVNLNDTVATAALPMLTPFQIRALKNYIILYGQLKSDKELAFIPGFDSVTIAMIRPLTKIEPYTINRQWNLANGKHTLVSGIGATLEQAAGYSDGTYDGDNNHAYLTYNYRYLDRISLRLAADKDPTEAWGKENFYSYHLMLSNTGPFEKIILGRYNLQFGQGLTLWTGLSPFRLLGHTPVRFGNGVRPAYTFYKAEYQEGAATTFRIGNKWKVSAFASKVDGERLLGGHLDYRNGNLILGFTANHIQLDDSIQVHDYAYNQNYFRGNRQTNLGLDFAYQHGALLLYGEASITSNRAPAIIAGAQLTASDQSSISLNYRYFSPEYNNLHSKAHGIGSTQNEQGLTLDAQTKLPWKINGLISLDLHHFPSPRYGCYSPSSGAWLRIQAARPLTNHTSFAMRYSYRLKERNIPNIDSTAYLGEQTMRHQLQAEVKSDWQHWRFTTRGIITRFDTEQSRQQQQGWLLMQSARYSFRKLQATICATWFDIDGYYARIYLNENNLQYAYSIPMLNGKGLRTYAVVHYSPNDQLTIAAKYTLTVYTDRDSIGSGHNMFEGNHLQTWNIQIRWKF